MVFSSIMLGMGSKIIANIVNSIMSGSRDSKRDSLYSHKDADWVKAQVELTKEINKDVFSKMCRMLIYIMLTSLFCYVSIYAMTNPIETDILVKNNAGLLSRLFTRPAETVEKVHNSGIVFSACLELIFIVLGSFTIPSNK